MISKEGIIKLDIYVHPLSNTQKIIFTDDKLHIHINEAPEKNKANKAVLKVLKNTFNTQIAITKGLSNRHKQVAITGKDAKDIKDILNSLTVSSINK